MKNTENVQLFYNKDIVRSIICNKCGNTHEPNSDDEYPHIHSVDVRFTEEYNNFRSKCWWFDLCDDCLVGFVKTFKHAPDWFMGDKGESTQRLFDEWVSDGCKPMFRF